ncbi:MAG TPA: sigma 54-interacting transcriptional regulator [Negativicutes bacterium]
MLIVQRTEASFCFIGGLPVKNALVTDAISLQPATTLASKLAVEIEKILDTKLTEAEKIERLIASYQVIESRLQAVLDTVGEAVCIIDENDQVVAWNSQSERLYGIATDEIIGKPIECFFSNLLLTKVMKNHQMVIETYHNPCPGTHVLINASPVRLADKVIGGVCAERNITELVHLNQKLSQTSLEVQSLKEEIDKINSKTDCFSAIYGHSSLIVESVSMARRVSATNVPILLRGESGSGKEIFARAIHNTSQRSGDFVAINCGAITATLFESELFGYQSGAFTGADRKGKTGLFEKAHGGTLFLDEIGELPKEMQVKLLRVLQEKSFYRVGGDKPVKVDVRIIAATHRDLEQMITQREFRDDLYYRLNVVTMSLPALRERLEDIPELVHRGLHHFSTIHGKKFTKVEPAVMAVFLDYSWPGNVRELYNVLERLVILADSDTLTLDYLPDNLLSVKPRSHERKPVSGSVDLLTVTSATERELIERILEETHYNKASAAKKLGIPRSTLYYKMRQLGLCVNKLTVSLNNGHN